MNGIFCGEWHPITYIPIRLMSNVMARISKILTLFISTVPDCMRDILIMARSFFILFGLVTRMQSPIRGKGKGLQLLIQPIYMSSIARQVCWYVETHFRKSFAKLILFVLLSCFSDVFLRSNRKCFKESNNSTEILVWDI